jgi:putative effector of murein hydrolase
MGASGHAIGTSAALELGETEGAMSGLAMGVMGIVTSLMFMVFF